MSPNLDSPATSASSASSSANSEACNSKSKLTDFSIAAIIGGFELNLKDNSSNHSPAETVLDLRKISITSCQSPSAAYSPASSTTTTTSTTSSFSEQIGAKKLRPKNFTCPLCKMAYSNNGQLKNHVRIHTGERPFQCTYPDCNKSFTRNEELTRHKLIHTGVRPHSCNYCGKKFGRKDHLKKHVRTHDRKQEFQKKVFRVVCGSPAKSQKDEEEQQQLGPKSSPEKHQQQVKACGGCFCC